MKRLFVLVCALWGASSFAQEIGSELPPEPPPGRPPTQYGADPTPPPETTPRAQQPAQDLGAGPRAGAFGLSAGFFGNVAAVGAEAPAPTLGFRYLATDSMALSFDVGTAVGFGNTFLFGFGLGFGVDAYLGSADKPLRPFIGGGVNFGMPVNRDFGNFSLALQVGGGAEYWFSEYFSVATRMMLSLPIPDLENADQLSLATVQPGLQANFYF